MNSQENNTAVAGKAPRLLDRYRQALEGWGFLDGQIESFAHWVAEYIRFYGLRHPRDIPATEVAAFVDQLRGQPQTTPEDEAAARAGLRFLYDVFLPGEAANPAAAATSGLRPDARPDCPAGPLPTRSPFLNRCHERLRLGHYSLRTEECYVQWIKRFILFHGKRHPEEMGAASCR